MKLFIKNINAEARLPLLTNILREAQVDYDDNIVEGAVKLNCLLHAEKLSRLKHNLEENGFEILHDRKQILAEQVKYVVRDLLDDESRLLENYSIYISKRLFLNYTYLANVFSEINGITIEHYIILLKIEKVKLLLLYSHHNITEIADVLHYSSIGHLSNQFKKETGLTPTAYKRQLRHAS